MSGASPLSRAIALLLPIFAWSLVGRGAESGSHLEMPSIPRPQIPDRTFELASFGASGDGTTLNTTAFQNAVDAVKKAGGGILHVPAGTFLTAPFHLTSRLNLHLDKAATIKMIGFTSAWPQENGSYLQYGILAEDCEDVAITGEGVIDGQGELCWERYRKVPDPDTGQRLPPKDVPRRPRLVMLRRCKRVSVEGVTLQNSPSFHLVPDQCEDVVIDGAHFFAPPNSPNTDGLDPSGWNFLITHCTFDVGDDCIAIKAGQKSADRPSCENFTITDCSFKRGHGLSIGSQTRGGLRNLLVRDCTFDGTDAGIRMKSSRTMGGLVENLTYENLTMKHVKVPIYITSYYPTVPADPAADPLQAVTGTTPIWKNIRIRHVVATGGEKAGILLGTPESPIRDVTMENVSIQAKKGMLIVNAKNVRLVHSTIESETGDSLTLHNADVTRLEALP